MAERGDKRRSEKRAEKPFKGVSNKGLVCEYKNASFYMTLPLGTLPEEAAILYDLVRLRHDPDVDEMNLNIKEVVKSLGISLDTDKKFYQKYLAAIPLGPLKKEEIWVTAQEVYNRLMRMKVPKLGETKGKRRRDVDDLPAKLEDGDTYLQNLNNEAWQSWITSKIAALEKAEKACEEKDAMISSQGVVISGKDAKIRELTEKVLHKDAEIRRLQEGATAYENAYGRSLEHRALFVTSTGELPPGDASMSKDAMPASGDALQTSLAAAEGCMTLSDDLFKGLINDDLSGLPPFPLGEDLDLDIDKVFS